MQSMEDIIFKKCTSCGETKPQQCFHKRSDRSSGFVSHCKDCRNLKRKLRYSNNIEKELKTNRQYYQSNKDTISNHKKDYYSKNRDQIRARHKEHYSNNKYQYHLAYLRRQKAIKQATIGNYDSELKEIYKNRPEGYHVDHIVPLQGETACGLHVPWNLQYLTAEENIAKSNKV